MTTNYERIKNMTVDEMAEFLKTKSALFVYKKVTSDYVDNDLIKLWLQAESEE